MNYLKKETNIKRKLLRAFSVVGVFTILMMVLNGFALNVLKDYSEEINVLFTDYHNAVVASDQEAITETEEELTSILQKTYTKIEGTLLFNLILGVVSVGLVLLCTKIFDGIIGKPLREVAEGILQVSKGNLTADFKAPKDAKELSKDEVIAMRQYMDYTETNLGNIIKDTRTISEEVVNSMKDLTEGADTVSKSAYDISCAVEEVSNGAVSTADDTSTAMEVVNSIGQNIEGIKENTEELTKASSNMNNAKDNVMDLLDAFVGVNKTMNQNIEETNIQINVTNDNVKEIQKFIEVIKDIASQTNLLSLNASIEAAHSGEAGKGFAVVAGEIRRLSEQSAKSSQEIEQTLNQLISNYELIIEKMNSTNENLNSQKEKLDETRNNFDVLEKDIKVTVDKITDIEQRVQHLDEMRATLVDIISNLSAISQENAASSEETTASIEELTSTVEQMCTSIKSVQTQANDLLGSLEVFKVRD